MSTPTTWNDEEYATLAGALLYPEGRRAVVVSGYSPAVPLAWQLDSRLQQLGPEAKARALDLARQIRAAEEAMFQGAFGGGSCAGAGRGAVLQVGDIRLDPRLGRTERETVITRARQRLALMVDFPVNPNAHLDASGGINGRWS